MGLDCFFLFVRAVGLIIIETDWSRVSVYSKDPAVVSSYWCIVVYYFWVMNHWTTVLELIGIKLNQLELMSDLWKIIEYSQFWQPKISCFKHSLLLSSPWQLEWLHNLKSDRWENWKLLARSLSWRRFRDCCCNRLSLGWIKKAWGVSCCFFFGGVGGGGGGEG